MKYGGIHVSLGPWGYCSPICSNDFNVTLGPPSAGAPTGGAPSEPPRGSKGQTMTGHRAQLGLDHWDWRG